MQLFYFTGNPLCEALNTKLRIATALMLSFAS